MSQKIIDLETEDKIYYYNRRKIKKITIRKIKKSAGWIEFFFETREDFSVLKLSEAKNDWLYYIIDQLFITTDKKILNEEIMKIYNFELKKTKSILFEWLLQGYKDRRF